MPYQRINGRVMWVNAYARPVQRPVQAPVQRPPAAASGIPSADWNYYRQFKIGQLPKMTAASADIVLRQHGFSATSSGGAARYEHVDGTWVNVAAGRLTLGFKQWHLGQLPYNNRISG